MLAGEHYSEYAVIALGVLQDSGNTLPVEVWRRDEREEKHDWCHEIEGEGMACRRLSDYLDTDILEIRDYHAMKVLAMLFSGFEEMVFIDADNMALQPPELLFNSTAYQETGVLLWHDLWKYDNMDWLDYVVGISDSRSSALWNDTTIESGQLVWDKRRHWKALLLATYYNYHGPALYYTILNHGFAGWGDKDTFPLALRALNESFHVVPDAPETVWVSGHVDDRRAGMLQMRPRADEARPTAFFLHATTIKWSHRDFLCVDCLPIWHPESPSDPFTSRYEDSGDELYGRLRSHQRIVDERLLEFTPDGMDAEVRMWRAMHHAACVSPAWRHARACAVGRKYMVETFGFTFTPSGGDPPAGDRGSTWVPGIDENVCLVDPP